MRNATRTIRPPLFSLLFGLLLVFSLKAAVPQSALPADNSHLLLGNPSDAMPNAALSENYLKERPQYALSYNSVKGGPNWVSWHLQDTDLGDVDRTDSYRQDQDLPLWWRIKSTAYAGSGYDRGHMCPSEDRTDTELNNRATFFMSNMLPQTPRLNRGAWAALEHECQTQAVQGNELFIIAGGYGTNGTIDAGRVNVPAICWKVIVELTKGDNDLQRINTDTRVVAVEIPNETPSNSAPWQSHRTTVAAIESHTGYRFLTNAPQPVRDTLATKTQHGF